jgi:ElaA protein
MSLQWQTLTFPQLDAPRLYAILRLRQNVFIVEQQCAFLDIDDLDLPAHHMLCVRDGDLLAYQRCLAPGLVYPESSLGRIVVDPMMRGQRIGGELVQRGIDYNLSLWPGSAIRINAQSHLQPFYADFGFIAEGDEYMEDNILHRQMRYLAPEAR